MTINSVTLTNGTPLKFVYDAKKDDDNLEITLDRAYKRGEDVSVKVEYRTNYVNTADTETAIGSFGRGLRFINHRRQSEQAAPDLVAGRDGI